MLEVQAIKPESTGTAAVSLAELVALAARGLPQMLDPQSRLFCYKLKKTPNGLEREGISHRYTMMTLLGLHRLEAAGHRASVDIQSVLEALLRDTLWIKGAGDLGLLLWTCAEIAPNRLPEVFVRTHPAGALRRFADALQGYTMEVAWFLAGVAHCLAVAPDELADLAQDGLEAFQLLKHNCGAGGIFGHLAKNKSVAGRFRGRIGSFADQVYPIYALSKLARVFGEDEPRQMALRTARTICRHQGPLGQWWWHYDSSNGRVVGRYAVYSVHQHAMAPMALLAMEEATGQDFRKPILTGLDWIAGHNELNLDMRDPASNVIWRCFYQSKYKSYSNELLGLAGLPDSPNGLMVRYECRPYELGWLLYAFASRALDTHPLTG
jgi:hypothetical protein